jgi:hypothetical protein
MTAATAPISDTTIAVIDSEDSPPGVLLEVGSPVLLEVGLVLGLRDGLGDASVLGLEGTGEGAPGFAINYE